MKNIKYIIKNLLPRRLFRSMQPAYHFILGWWAARRYAHPSNELIVIGVTGTTGKTTAVYMMARALNAAGIKTGFTSTALFNDGEREWTNDKKMTMIGRSFTQQIMRDMVKNGCRVAIIETTSEGVVQYRHRFINYDALVVTGLYPEHIESHGSFEAYKSAKGRLFAHLKSCATKYIDPDGRVVRFARGMQALGLSRVKKTTIVNGDDEHADYFLSFPAESKIVVKKGDGLRVCHEDACQVWEYDSALDESGRVVLCLGGHEVKLGMLGMFNALNGALAAALVSFFGIDIKEIARAMHDVGSVPGRLELIDSGQDFTVIVDYAFEPTALSKLYETISPLRQARVLHVLGSAGGGRDVARRPKLGAVAGERADLVFVTDEDPYDDDPLIIIDQVSLGAEKAGKKIGENLWKIENRREAIRRALGLAQAGDIVLVTGKGSEQSICRAAEVKEVWDDRVVVREELEFIKKSESAGAQENN